jgi:hypothetical protein
MDVPTNRKTVPGASPSEAAKAHNANGLVVSARALNIAPHIMKKEKGPPLDRRLRH